MIALRKNFSWIIALLFLFGCAAEQKPTTASPAADRGLFWKAEKNGQVTYLLGTVHAWRPEWLPLNTKIETALAEAKLLAVELDPSDQSKAVALAPMMLLEKGETAEAILGKDLIERTKRVAGKFGFPEQAVSAMKPWAVAVSVTALSINKLGYSFEKGIDAYLINKAKTENKVIIELESFESQVKVMNRLDNKTQAALITETLDSIESADYRQIMEEMTASWKKGDPQVLIDTYQKGVVNPHLRKAIDEHLLYSRDIEFARKIDELSARSSPNFVAIGSLHLVGSRSVLEQLKAKGYKITQL